MADGAGRLKRRNTGAVVVMFYVGRCWFFGEREDAHQNDKGTAIRRRISLLIGGLL